MGLRVWVYAYANREKLVHPLSAEACGSLWKTPETYLKEALRIVESRRPKWETKRGGVAVVGWHFANKELRGHVFQPSESW